MGGDKKQHIVNGRNRCTTPLVAEIVDLTIMATDLTLVTNICANFWGIYFPLRPLLYGFSVNWYFHRIIISVLSLHLLGGGGGLAYSSAALAVRVARIYFQYTGGRGGEYFNENRTLS